jgi:PleD family two-component response regulator
MTKQKQILVISDPETMSQRLFDWINNNEDFGLSFAETPEAAIELFHQNRFDLVLTGDLDEAMDLNKLKAIVPILQEDAIFMQAGSASAAELDEKIRWAFDQKKYVKMMRMMVLDSSEHFFTGLPSFSLN